jgi:tetratricopeptide (TPR) repeat protein
MNRQKTIYGADDPTTLKLMDAYAALLSKMGAHNQACLLHQECVSEKAATLGPNHTGTINSKFALAASYLELGRNMEMERLCLEGCLSDQETRLGETHPSTISSMVKLGALYLTMTKCKEGLELFKTCYDVRCKSLGKDHELTLGVANNIAATYDTMDKYKEAQEVYESTLTILEEKLGKTHLSTTALLLNIGLLYQRMGNLPKAHKFYVDTLELCTEAYGEKHPRTLMAFDNLGCVCLIEEKFAEAKLIFEKSMVLKKGLYDDSHPLMLTNLENLASAMQRLGQKAEALELYKKLCGLKEAAFGAKHIQSIKGRAGMAIVMAELGAAQDALNIMIACVQDTSAILGPAAPAVQEYLGVIGYIYAIYGKFDEGIRYTNMALAGTINIYGEKHFLVKSLLERKVWMLTNSGRTGEAAQITAIIQAMPADGSGGAGIVKPAAAAAAGAAAGGASAANAPGTSSPEGETISPLQQQLQAEAAVDRELETQITARLQNIIALLQAGQLPTAAAMVENFLQNDVNRIRETSNLLLAANVAAYVLNAQQPPLALRIMMTVYPIVSANFSSYKEVLLPCMDLLGKAHAYSGNVPAAIPILEEYMQLAQKDLVPGTPNPTLAQTQDLMVKLYGSTRQFDKAIGIYTAQFEYFKSTEGEASEAAITAINNRAMYWFALKDFEKSRADHREVIRLLIVLQGADHPETIQSVDGFKTLYASNGMEY